MIRYIYTFFVGLFLAVFVGTGIAVFYPSPPSPEPPSWYGTSYDSSKTGPTLTEAEKQQEQAYMTAQRQHEKDMQHYNRNVSVIALLCAIVILTVGLAFSNKLGVVADGILLGGIFTLLYGIIRGMDTGSNKYRFLVSTVGLVTAIVLGYIKFTRHQKDERLPETKI